MIYKTFKDLKLSMLGMGNMRLPTEGENGPIDVGKAREIIEYAYEHGINYFDTAYRYHNGQSELVVGEALSKYSRSSWYLASKMPGHMMNYIDGKLGFQGYLSGEPVSSPSAIFEEQLRKCGVDYFDFYLLHNVSESSYDIYTNEELGIVDYLLEEKKAGRIRHLGFSAHGRADTIERFLNWRDCFEFVQIQLNYLDWDLQEARLSYELLQKRGIPVIVMEPCRGGRLTHFQPEIEARVKSERPGRSLASLAFDFVKSLSGVQVVLSGMTTLDQLKDNLQTFESREPLADTDKALISEIVSSLVSLVPCTACRYCCEECPQGLDIPKLISLYNEINFEKTPGLQFILNGMTPDQLPESCIGCGSCSKICPQGIDVPMIMKKLAASISTLS